MESAPTIAAEKVANASAAAMATPLVAGDIVSTAYGRGEVLRVVGEDESAGERYAISLKDWTMAQGQSPVLFMAPQEKSLLRYEAPVDIVAEMFDKCAQKKDDAADLFKAQDFEGAKNVYADILGMINGLSELLPAGATVSDLVRARIIELIIPCQNNIALCCLNLKDFQGCLESAKAACDVVEGCQSTPGLARVLATRDITEEKLLVDYKKKSHLYMGKALMGKTDYDRAMEHFQEGLKIVESASSDRKTDVKSFSDLIEMCRRTLKKQEEREKKTWSNVFKKDSAVADESSTSSSGLKTKGTITTPLPPLSPNVNDDDVYVNDGDDEDDEDDEESGVLGSVEKFVTDNSPFLLAGAVAAVGIAAFAFLKSRK